jgi:amidophosphoribosyltransferase
MNEIFEACKQELTKPISEMENKVKLLYDRFSDEELQKEIARLVTPEDMYSEVEIVYQTIEGLHSSCPNHLGDWYFTGDYPTAGGNKVVNQSYVYYMEGNKERAY